MNAARTQMRRTGHSQLPARRFERWRPPISPRYIIDPLDGQQAIELQQRAAVGAAPRIMVKHLREALLA